MPERVDHPIILGIVGDSASGKSTLSEGVARILGEKKCSVYCTDDYHCYTREERNELGISALDPRANYIDILEQHLQMLKQGESVLKPVYCHENGTLERPRYFKPTDFVIVEGLLGYSTRKMRDCYDVKIYLDPLDDLRIKWKLHRDTTKRNYNLEEVVASLERRKQDSPQFIHPQRTFADIVIRFRTPQESDEAEAQLDVRHLLRPTLPHPDFTALFDGTGNAGLRFELARDKDGKPVDVLEINGNISDKRAERIESLLWSFIAGAGHRRDQADRIGASAGNGLGRCNALTLTQLLVGYHAVKAAMGVHAY